MLENQESAHNKPGGNGSRGQGPVESAPEQPVGCMLAPNFHTLSFAPAKQGSPVSKGSLPNLHILLHHPLGHGVASSAVAAESPLERGKGDLFCSNCSSFS